MASDRAPAVPAPAAVTGGGEAAAVIADAAGDRPATETADRAAAVASIAAVVGGGTALIVCAAVRRIGADILSVTSTKLS